MGSALCLSKILVAPSLGKSLMAWARAQEAVEYSSNACQQPADGKRAANSPVLQPGKEEADLRSVVGGLSIPWASFYLDGGQGLSGSPASKPSAGHCPNTAQLNSDRFGTHQGS